MSDVPSIARRDHGQPGPTVCESCGGAYTFDTALPSETWNRVIRAREIPDRLCLPCIVVAFVAAGESFTGELYGPGVHGERVPLVTLTTDARPIAATYGTMQARIRDLSALLKELADFLGGHGGGGSTHYYGCSSDPRHWRCLWIERIYALLAAAPGGEGKT